MISRDLKVRCLPTVVVLVILFGPGNRSALAGDFALAVSPPRFELESKAGERTRHVLEITNASAEATPLTAKTADWSLSEDNSVAFFDELQPESCRPWVSLERRELTVSAGRPYRFRFEINPPADTQVGECRFAIMLEGQEQVSRPQGGPAVAFSARIAVVVYAAIGGAAPVLSVIGANVQLLNGKLTPMLQVLNSGAAHGRLGGFLTGVDASGGTLEFSPDAMPVLAGQTRSIALSASKPGDSDTEVQVKLPVTVKGKLEWGKGQSQQLDQRFSR